jgi:hypothetical protein
MKQSTHVSGHRPDKTGIMRIVTLACGIALSLLIALGAFVDGAHATPADHNLKAQTHPTTVFPEGKHDVVIGAYMGNIQSIDFETSSFTADFFIWMRWTNRDLNPNEHFEIMNSSDSWSTTIAPLEVGPIEQADGTLYQSFHYQGSFNFKPRLEDFPFGTQILPIIVEGTLSGEFGINFIPDSTPVVVDPGLTLPGYSLGQVTLDTSLFSYATDFGEVGTDSPQEYSRTVISLPISLPIWSNIVKYFLPLFLVVITASLVFLIPPRLGEARIALGITALLTMVAMEGSKANGLPSVEYLMLIDVLYILSYLFIVATIFHSIALTWAQRNVSEDLEGKDSRRFTLIYLAGYFAAVTLTILLFVLS